MEQKFVRKIGVIGGAGVAAAAELVVRIERLVTSSGAYLDQQHPELILYQLTQAPSRSMYVEGRGESFVPQYVDAAKRLRTFGADFVAMCCNTAHFAIQELEDQSGVKFINLIEEAAAESRRMSPKARRVGIMCSDGTRIGQMYDRALKVQESALEAVYPIPEVQGLVTQGIRAVKRGEHLRPHSLAHPTNLFTEAAKHLHDSGCDVIILACTEIPLALGKDASTPVPIVDTLDVLASACIREARENG